MQLEEDKPYLPLWLLPIILGVLFFCIPLITSANTTIPPLPKEMKSKYFIIGYSWDSKEMMAIVTNEPLKWWMNNGVAYNFVIDDSRPVYYYEQWVLDTNGKWVKGYSGNSHSQGFSSLSSRPEYPILDSNYTVTKLNGDIFFNGDSFGEGNSNDSEEDEDGSDGWWSSFPSLDDFRNSVGGWIGSALAPLVQPINALGDFINDLTDSIAEFFSSIWDKLVESLEAIYDFASQVGEGFAKLFGFINPFSEDFFISSAFVPSDEFFTNYIDRFDSLLKDKLGFFYQVYDSFKAVTNAMNSTATEWKGVTADLSNYGIGEVEIINGHAIVEYGHKIRFWVGGLMLFFTGAFLIRKISGLVGEGK